MKNIVIRKMVIENFKGHARLELDFGGESRSIYGDNATGKTSVYDALTWLLFGKDSRGNGEKNMEIKPLDPDGNVADHEAVTSVEAVLEVRMMAGVNDPPYEVGLRKTMRESWVSRRGSSQLVYDGNLFEYAIDGVPMKKNEYTARIRELVDEEVFKVLTSVTAFSEELHWQKRREILYDLSGVAAMSDRALMQSASVAGASNPPYGAVDFSELAELMGSKSLEDLKKILQQKRRNLMGVKDQTPARINELDKQQLYLAGIDFEAAEDAKNEAEARAAQIRAEIERLRGQTPSGASDPTAGASNQAGASNPPYGMTKTMLALREVKTRIGELELKNRQHRRAQQDELPSNLQLTAEQQQLERKISWTKELIERAEQNAEYHAARISEARKEWVSSNNESFTGGTCPTCGQELPVERLRAAREKFEAEKGKRLAAIERDAAREKEAEERCREEAATQKASLEALLHNLDRVKAELLEVERAQVEAKDLDGYTEEIGALRAEESRLEAQKAKEAEDTQKQEEIARAQIAMLEEKLGAANLEARQLGETLGQRSVLAYTEKRIAELRAEQKKAASELEQTDAMLWKIEEFTRWKAGFIEDSVNGLFRLARFRLFREQANGGLEERCDVVYNGVPYQGLNTGARINVGIDIIDRLAEHYGVRVPLFIDNAEAVTQLEQTQGQVIRLVVSEQDKVLRIE